MRIVGALAVGAALTAYWTSFYPLRAMELRSVDTRFQIRGTEEPPDDLVVVAIDDTTFSDLDLQWPFPRRYHARMIDRLHNAGAKAIAYDVQFSEETTRRDDNALILAARRARSVVLSTTETCAPGAKDALPASRTSWEARRFFD